MGKYMTATYGVTVFELWYSNRAENSYKGNSNHPIDSSVVHWLATLI